MAVETFATLAETTTTADPGSGGTSLAVTSRSLFPQSGQFRLLVQDSETSKTNREIMLATAGWGSGAGSFTVTRGLEGTTGVAHASGSYVAQVLTALGLASAVVAPTLFDANTILKADSDDTPVALTMGASTILARLASGSIVAATPAELRTLLALVIGTNVQAWDADLDALAALTTTAFGRSLLDDANASTALTTLSAGRSHTSLSPVANVVSESCRRDQIAANNTVIASGRLQSQMVSVVAGDVISSVSFIQGVTAFTVATNAWFGVADSSLNLIRQSIDQLTAGITAKTVKTLAVDSVPVTVGARAGSTTVTLTIPTMSEALSTLFAVNDSIVVSNANVAAYNGTFTVASVSATQITYVCGGSATDSLAAPFPTVQLAAGKRTFTVPTTGYVYACIMSKGTVGTHYAPTVHADLVGTITPLYTGQGATGLTGTCPSPITVVSGGTLAMYAAVS